MQNEKVLSFEELEKKCLACRKDFPMLQNKEKPLIYFDNAATSLKPFSVIEACTKYYTELGSNAHRSDFSISHQLEKEVKDCRKLTQAFLHAASEKEIIFTSGATAALNQIAYGFQDLLSEGDVVLTSRLEHASAILPWFEIAKQKKAKIEYIPLKNGHICLNRFEKLLHPKVKVLVLTHMSNTLAYLNPLEEICKIAHKHNVFVFVDAAQSVAHTRIDVQKLQVDALAFSCHKILGPTGLGVLYLPQKHHSFVKPFMLGGGSNARFFDHTEIWLKEAPEKFESGTQNLSAILGFKEALLYYEKHNLDDLHHYEEALLAYLKEKVKHFSHIEIYNADAQSGNLLFNCKGIFAQDAANYFAQHGIALRAGHHCAKLAGEVYQSPESLRVSLAFYNSKQEIDTFVQLLETITLEKCVELYL